MTTDDLGSCSNMSSINGTCNGNIKVLITLLSVVIRFSEKRLNGCGVKPVVTFFKLRYCIGHCKYSCSKCPDSLRVYTTLSFVLTAGRLNWVVSGAGEHSSVHSRTMVPLSLM